MYKTDICKCIICGKSDVIVMQTKLLTIYALILNAKYITYQHGYKSPKLLF